MDDRQPLLEVDSEKLMHLHDKLRDEIQMHYNIHNRQLTAGLSAIILILGYGLISGNIIVIPVIPFLLGFIFISSVMSINRALFNAKTIAEIEMKISEPGSLFRYESEYGGAFGEKRKISWKGRKINPSLFPYYVAILFSSLTYFALVAISIIYIPILGSIEVLVDETPVKDQIPSNPYWQILGYSLPADTVFLIMIYFIFTIILGITGWSLVAVRKELQEDHREMIDSESDHETNDE